VSTRDQAPENQLRQLRLYARSQGWKVTTEYVDVETGANGKRPQFLAMMEAAGRHEFDVLLYWALDRLSREGVAQTFRYLEQLRAAGVAWHDFTNPITSATGPYADLFIAISAVWAKVERELISARTKAALDRARAQGKTLGRPRADVDPRRLERYHAQGYSVAKMARLLKVSRQTVLRRLRA
jgi:DNA invertase Pin-like site-specific DNA recombinase